jgi:uncharacterized protein (TIGR02246 family)
MRPMKQLTLVLILLGALPAWAAGQVNKEDAEIRAVMTAQADAWNRGDIEGFMHAYKDSPDTTFIGKSIRKGYRDILERYKTGYPNQETMGTLKFWDLQVTPLGTKHAVVVGHFHLDRAAKGDQTADDGVFSLVFEKTAAGWKVILDHTSS